jgi:uncharacterized protein YjiS (DUF1127 family)
MHGQIYGRALVAERRRPSLPQRLETILIAAFDRLLAWQELVRSRDMLMKLDDRMLRDIGVHRGALPPERPLSYWH